MNLIFYYFKLPKLNINFFNLFIFNFYKHNKFNCKNCELKYYQDRKIHNTDLTPKKNIYTANGVTATLISVLNLTPKFLTLYTA